MEFKRSTRQLTRQPSYPNKQAPSPFSPRPIQPRPTIIQPPTVAESPNNTLLEEPSSPDPVRRRIVITGALIIVLIVVSAVVTITLHSNDAPTQSNQSSSQGLGFTPILPSTKTIDQLGGWKRVSPVDKDPVYAYADTVDGVTISVSEQPIPASFKASVEASVAELARGYSAKAEIGTGANTVYIGTSAKGPQSVIFTKNGLLVLIKSQKVIQISSWAKYIGSLN